MSFPASWTDNQYYNLKTTLSSVTQYNFDGLLVCGDLTTESVDSVEVGTVADYQTAKSLIAPVKNRFHQMLLGMGNHDGQGNYQKVFGNSRCVKAIVSGHLHRFSFDMWNGRTYLLNLPPTDPSGLPYRGPAQVQITRSQPLQMNGIGTGLVDASFAKTNWALTMMSTAGSPAAFPGSAYNWLL